jgi:hypothetical protein
MGSLETLSPDQRAVLDLVLQRGRSYDDIARLLGIDRAAVRARALAAFDELGPDTEVAPESRALITDYLLGQLPERVAEQTRERLANSPHERAWARVLASELAPVASKPLPEIPDGTRPATAGASTTATESTPARSEGEPAGQRARAPKPSERGSRRPPRLSDPSSSRLGGAILLGVGALIVVAVVIILIAVLGAGSSSKHPSSTAAASGTSPAGASSTSSTSTTGSKAQVVAQTNLNPPSGSSSAAKGVAFVVKEGRAYGVVIEAAHVPPNSHNAYAAWLYNSPTDAYRIGFVSPLVGKSGQLQVGSPLPANAGHFKQLLLTVETKSNPKTPGTVVLEGPFQGVPAAS